MLEVKIDQSELSMWLSLETTQKIFSVLKKHIELEKENITDGTLITSTELAREYCYSVGRIKGLEELVNIKDNIEVENASQ